MKKERFANDKATIEWLNSFDKAKNTRFTYQTGWTRFLEYTGMTGDAILAARKDDKDFNWEKKTVDFKRWMVEEKKLSTNSARTAATAVEGFFSYHRMPLMFRRSESERIREAKRKTEDYRFSRDDLKRMVDNGDLTEKYIVTAGKSFGLRAGDFLRLTRGDLEAYIDRQVPISIGEYTTQKEGVSAYPFIDSDAQPIIKALIEQMDRKGLTDPKTRILKYKDEIQLSRVLQRLADKAGIKYGSKNVRFHCLRKFLIDHLSSHMSTEKWKQIVGKAISEGAYVSADSLREDYQRAMDETTFTKSVSENEIEMRATQRMLEMTLTLSPNIPDHIKEAMIKKIRAVKKMEDLKPVENEIAEQVKRSVNTSTQTNACADGKHCQRVVVEAELETLLAQGWSVAAVLPSGKIVVSNE